MDKRSYYKPLPLLFEAQPESIRYGLVTLAVSVAVVVHSMLAFTDSILFFLFFFVIFHATFWLGRNPGIVALLLSLIAVNVFVLFPDWIAFPYDALIFNVGFSILAAAIITLTLLYRNLTAALWENRQDLHYVQTVGKIGNWRLEIPSGKLRCCRETYRILCLPEGMPITYEAFFSCAHPDDREYLERTLHASLHGEPYDIEHRLDVGGEVKWVRKKAVFEFGINGNLIGLIGTLQDITDRKRYESALRERERELQLMMNAMPVLIFYLDTEFRFIRMNAACAEWFGAGVEQMIGRTAQEIIGAKYWDTVGAYFQTALAGERGSFDRVIPYGNGKPRWVHATYVPHKAATGTVEGIVVHIVDIDARKRAERQISLLNRNLQRRIEEMQVIFDTAPIGLIIAERADGRRLRGNPAITRLLGELADNGYVPAAHSARSDDRELAIEELPIQRAIRGQPVTDKIVDIRREDGKMLTLLCNAAPLFDEERRPRGAVGAFLDITLLKRVEEALKKSQMQLRLFIEQAPLSIAMFDRDMTYLAASRRWIEEFGRGYADLTGLNHYMVHSDISAEWKRVYRRAQAGEFIKNDDDLRLQPDGTRCWLRWTAYPWTDQKGEIGGIIISIEDRTAQRIAEEELRIRDARLTLAIEEINAGYWDWDLPTSTLYLSPEWKRQIGFNDDELPNCWDAWESRIHLEDREFVLTATEDFLTGRLTVYELEFRLRHKDGSYRWIHSRGSLLVDAHNRPHRMLGINLDITDYVKSKELSERRSKIEEAFRFHVAGQTAAAIAHELNQPLIAISAYADAALHMLQSSNPNPPKLFHALENCSLQAHRAGQAIRQLLKLLHQGEADSESIDINAEVLEALDIVRADESSSDFAIEMNLGADLMPVTANRLQFQKVLVNLLRNSLESMQDNANKSAVMAVTTRVCPDDPVMLQVSVCDNGRGVPDASVLRSMFQPFFTTKSNGLGMGLAVSRALIEAHGGKMWAEANSDGGLSVHFTLPLDL